MPSAWGHNVAYRGLTPESLDALLTLEELAVARQLFRIGIRRLTAWRRELRIWLHEVDRSTLREEPQEGENPSPAGLEERYELLLRLNAIDREPLQRQTAIELRSSIRRHIIALAAAGSVSATDKALQLAMQFADARGAREISSEEAATYRACIAHYQHLAVKAFAK